MGLIASGTLASRATTQGYEFVSDLLANGGAALTEVSTSGTNYARQNLASVTYTVSGLVTTLGAANPNWTSANFTAIYGWVHDDTAGGTDATRPLICIWDFGGVYTLNPFTIVVNSAGLVRGRRQRSSWAIALDGSTPAVIDDIGTSSATEVTASFSPPAKSLVVVVVNLVYAIAMPWSSEPLTVSDSLSNSYAAGPIAQDPDCFSATSGIFTNYYASAPGSITLTATRNPPTLYPALFEVVTHVLTGARASQSGAGSAATYVSSPSSGVVYSNITVTSGRNSWVIVGAKIKEVSSTISGSPSGVGGTDS